MMIVQERKPTKEKEAEMEDDDVEDFIEEEAEEVSVLNFPKAGRFGSGVLVRACY